jgi:mannose-6-phosphate isomerase
VVNINKNGQSFTVYMCVGGNFIIEVKGVNYQYIQGATVLIPAEMSEFTISGKATLLEIYIS